MSLHCNAEQKSHVVLVSQRLLTAFIKCNASFCTVVDDFQEMNLLTQVFTFECGPHIVWVMSAINLAFSKKKGKQGVERPVTRSAMVAVLLLRKKDLYQFFKASSHGVFQDYSELSHFLQRQCEHKRVRAMSSSDRYH